MSADVLGDAFDEDGTWRPSVTFREGLADVEALTQQLVAALTTEPSLLIATSSLSSSLVVSTASIVTLTLRCRRR